MPLIEIMPCFSTLHWEATTTLLAIAPTDVQQIGDVTKKAIELPYVKTTERIELLQLLNMEIMRAL